MASVTEMYSLGWEKDGDAWQWSRRLLAWEEEQVRLCSEILSNIVLQPNLPDKWFWHLHASKNDSITSAYNYMISTVNVLAADHT